MKRRNFIKLGALALSPVLIKSLNDWMNSYHQKADFDIEILSDAGVGHLLWESKSYPIGNELTTEYLIVGGGIAGLSAAYQLREEDFLLCELSERLGGSSSSNYHKDQHFAQGAHYDLAYPAYYGKELLQVLFDLNIIDFDTAKQTWTFVDRHFLIDPTRESISFDKGQKRADVLPEGKTKERFEALLRPFIGHMPMPTWSIDPAYHYLNEMTFYHFLMDKLQPDPHFMQAIDYAMLDDWGGTAKEVSALAGIHYYTCRPYFDGNPELFSPPEGNAYFAQKFISKIPQQRLKNNHLVRQINKTATGFEVMVVDIKQQQQIKINTTKIVYAAHKHTLKYIYPAAYPAFQSIEYAPWVAMNIILNTKTTEKVFWQNEYLSGDSNFMGFVDSASQFNTLTNERRTLTAYYCLKPSDRKALLKIDQTAPTLVAQTIEYIEEVFGKSITPQIEKVYLKVMGHAMPIPAPNYLLRDFNKEAAITGIAFAGVDGGRLPLFFEAADSGLQAAKILQQKMTKG